MTQKEAISLEDDFIEVRMSISEFVEWKKHADGKQTKLLRKGLAGVMDTFQCSKNQAFKISHADWFAPCKVQMGKHLVFDANKAWELAKEAGY